MVQNKTKTLLSAYGAIKTAAAKAVGKLNGNKRELTMRFYKEGSYFGYVALPNSFLVTCRRKLGSRKVYYNRKQYVSIETFRRFIVLSRSILSNPKGEKCKFQFFN